MSENTFPVRDDRWTSGEDVQAHVAEGPEDNEVEGHVARPGQDRIQGRKIGNQPWFGGESAEDDVEGHIRSAFDAAGDEDGDVEGHIRAN